MALLRKPFFHLLLLSVLLLGNLQAQVKDDNDEDPSPYAAGLIVDSESVSRRLASQIFLTEVNSSQEQTWIGFLESDASGEYRIAAQFVGDLLIELKDKTVIRAKSDDLRWIVSDLIHLEYDHHAIRVTLNPASDGMMSLTTFWSGPGFRLEPIPAKHLSHDAEHTFIGTYRRGEQLLRSLRCEACHTLPNIDRKPLRSPDLALAGQYLRADWMHEFFHETAENRFATGSPLAALHAVFDEAAATDIVEWLQSRSQTEVREADVRDGDAAAGETLLLTVGCVGCHVYGDVGTSPLFGGGDLTNIANKRPVEFFRKWLDDPGSVNLSHRMPKFDLDDSELTDLSTLLANTRKSSVRQQRLKPGNARRGQELYEAHRCAACHNSSTATKRIVISSESDWSNACGSTIADGRPRYNIRVQDQRAIAEFVQHAPLTGTSQGALLLSENNCLQCHSRGESLGLTPINEKVAEVHSDLVDRLSAMTPPTLNGAGDKLLDRVLRRTLARGEEGLRPWLSVRMPKFPLGDGQIDAITEYLVSQDRVPDIATDQAGIELSDNDRSVAARMVTSDGFGCTSCHAIGNVEPSEKTPANQRAPSLSMLKNRVRKIWFDRWVRNPARITSKMEMPSVQTPIPLLMGEDLDRQLNAVWDILNTPSFSPPDPSPTRIVRLTGRRGERAAVLTDVVLLNGEKLLMPFLVGLPNRHNVLMDLQRGRLASWWTGDAARQRTQGKTWYWESSALILPATNQIPEIVLLRDDSSVIEPRKMGQFVAEPDEWSHVDNGVELKHRLHFPSFKDLGSAELRTMQVIQRFTAIESGWERQLSVSGLAPNELIGVRSSFETIESSRKYGANGDLLKSRADAEGRAEMTLQYQSNQKVAEAMNQLREFPRSNAKLLDVMPGFSVLQLPLRSDIMPISLGWRPNGELLLGSLKGRVWSVKDSDGDGLQDQICRVSDDLAAPYGISATNDYIDVATKYGLVRCHDADRDGIAERHEVAASGWGHTDDYHDWVVGLPQDEAGNYFLTVPCQQDERSEAAAYLRGRVLKLVKRAPTAENPRRYDLQEVSGGHRFPMGIARNAAGQLLVTDNQGNYNPFNELNHVIQGSRYGFINRLERSADFNPPLTPPAIDIPHPWTRSVNGICFLETPRSMASQGSKLFGPFEGHLVGCEYDTRRLIRMSLEEVKGTLQGAVYPFAEAPEDPTEGLQGPINCGIAKDGVLYVANIRDSGWGGANNTGSLVRIVPDLDKLPAGIAEVRALAKGFQIHFTRRIDEETAADVRNYSLSSYRRISTPAYGGDDIDRRQESVLAASVAADGMSVDLLLNELRLGFVYEFRLKRLRLRGRESHVTPAEFYPSEAFYTLRNIPNER